MWRSKVESGWIGSVLLALLVAPVGEAVAQSADELPEELLMGPEGARPMFERDGRIWWLGWQASLGREFISWDEIDQSGNAVAQPVGYEWGLGFAIPMMLDLYNGLGMRFKLAATYSGDPPMNDAVVHISYTIPAGDDGEPAVFVDKDLPGFFGSLQLNTGISYTHPLLEGAVNPYAGFGPALILVMVFPDLAESDAVLLENPDEDDSGISSIDPYSVNISPGINAFFGVDFALTQTLYLNVEADYTQAKVGETHLEKAKSGYDTSRGAFTYGALTLSTGLAWHF